MNFSKTQINQFPQTITLHDFYCFLLNNSLSRRNFMEIFHLNDQFRHIKIATHSFIFHWNKASGFPIVGGGRGGAPHLTIIFESAPHPTITFKNPPHQNWCHPPCGTLPLKNEASHLKSKPHIEKWNSLPGNNS